MSTMVQAVRTMVDRADLMAAVRMASAIIPAGKAGRIAEIERCVRIRGKGSSIEISSVRTAILHIPVMQLTTRIPAQSPTTFEAVVNARTLLALLRHAPETYLRVGTEGDELTISWPGADYRLTGQNPADWPQVEPDEEKAVECEIGTLSLRRLLDQTLYAVSRGADPRPAMNCVRLSVHDRTDTLRPNSLRALATDSIRIASATARAEWATGSTSALVDSQAAKVLAWILQSAKVPSVQMRISKSFLTVEIGAVTTIRIKLTQADYPDLDRLVPTEFPVWARVERYALLQAIRRLRAMPGKDPSVRITLPLDRPCLRLQAVAVGRWSAEETVPAEISFPAGQPAEAFVIGFNPRYIADAIQTMISEDILLEFTTPREPARIRPTDDGEDCWALVLPIITY